MIFSRENFLFFFYCLKDELLSIWQERNIAKIKKNYSKEKAVEYYLLNQEAIKKRQKIGTKIWQTKRRKQKRNIKKIITRN